MSARFREHLQGAIVENPCSSDLWQVGGNRLEHGLVAVTLEEDSHRPGVAEHPCHLLGRRRLVHGHTCGARVPDRVVDDGPFVARARHDADALAGVNAVGHQALGNRAHPIQELLRRHGGPSTARGERQDLTIRVGPCPLDHVVGEAARRGGGNDGGGGKLGEHGTTLGHVDTPTGGFVRNWHADPGGQGACGQ